MNSDNAATTNVRTYKVNFRKTNVLPETYACHCPYCSEYKGMLIRPDGTYYNRNDRRKYYEYKHGGGGAGHINPTPLHVARWAIQTFTKPGDLVIDPFVGTGTTIVEAMNHGRKGFGTEVDSYKLAQRNIDLNVKGVDFDMIARVEHVDARKISLYGFDNMAQLVVLHPPYSGDEQSNAKYDRTVAGNMAFMKESPSYWTDMANIFAQCYDTLKPGGYAVIGVKEMMKNKMWWDLHIKYSEILANFQMEYKGMVLLPHYPRTLHLNTYYKRYGIHPSYYQTITIFRKPL